MMNREKVSVMKHDGEKMKYNHTYTEYWEDPDLVILENISGERKKQTLREMAWKKHKKEEYGRK